MKEIWKKIKAFFINWFWWKWRAKKYDRDSNKFRHLSFKFVKELYEKGFYIYNGFGTALTFLRDNDMKNQDIDIVIDKKTHDSYEFKNLIKKYNLKKWQEIRFDGILRIDKYILNKKVPFEFFICDNNLEKEVTYDALDNVCYSRAIPWQKLSIYKTKFGEIIFPKNLEQYVIDNYGERYNKKIKFNYNFLKHSNLSTLEKTDEKVTYNEF